MSSCLARKCSRARGSIASAMPNPSSTANDTTPNTFPKRRISCSEFMLPPNRAFYPSVHRRVAPRKHRCHPLPRTQQHLPCLPLCFQALQHLLPCIIALELGKKLLTSHCASPPITDKIDDPGRGVTNETDWPLTGEMGHDIHWLLCMIIVLNLSIPTQRYPARQQRCRSFRDQCRCPWLSPPTTTAHAG